MMSLSEVRTLAMTELLGGHTLFERLGNDRAQQIHALHDRLVRDLLGDFPGREIEKSRRFLLLFERPLDAVAYCLAYQQAVQGLSSEIDGPSWGRAAIHLGEVVLWQTPPEHISRGAKSLEVEGPARTTVARVLSLAGAGQTLLSQVAFDLARRGAVGDESFDDDVVWLSHGRYRFAAAEEVLEIFEVGVKGVGPLTAPAPPASSEGRRVTPVQREDDDAWRPAPGEPIPDRHNWMLERPLEKATYGEVWLARHRKTGDRHAFRFSSSADDLPRMHRQLAVIRHLRDSSVDREVAVPTLEGQLEAAPYFLESEYADSDTLAAWAQAHGDLGAVPLATRVEIVAQLAEIVAAVHSAGVVLDNLRPRSVVIRERSGSAPSVLLSDLSLARIVGDAAGAASEALAGQATRDSTPDPYRAPELESEAPTPAGDVYALGILLYQLAAGDLDRPLGPFWERDVDDELLRRQIAGLADPDPRARPMDLSEVARRLRGLE